MVAAAHTAVATAHSSSATTAAHPSSTHPAAPHAVTATATGVAASMLLTAVGRGSVRGLIGTGNHPLPAEIHGRIGRGGQRQSGQQTKRKNNTHAPILLYATIPI
jgi:hypothetical protein